MTARTSGVTKGPSGAAWFYAQPGFHGGGMRREADNIPIPAWLDVGEYERNYVLRRLMDFADEILKLPPSERHPKALDREAACRSAILYLQRAR